MGKITHAVCNANGGVLRCAGCAFFRSFVCGPTLRALSCAGAAAEFFAPENVNAMTAAA
jgi:hypothetical protein